MRRHFVVTDANLFMEILNANNLGNFYELNKILELEPDLENLSQFDYLDTPEIFRKK